MFEAHVLHLLRQYLGEYVHGLSAEALKISVWQGDVVLKDLQLKAEALNSLKLPVTVKAGFLGSVTLKVPWNRLGKESVVVLLDRIFILAEPIQDERTSKENEKEKLLEAKRRRLEKAESAMLEAKEKKTPKAENSAEASSWLGSLIATIIGNLKISITNVHIRYEDITSNPGKPFCSGVTLSRLAAVTIDENDKETFVPSGALDKLHKSLHLERFAIYHDSNRSPWKVGKNWDDMTPKEWCEVFESGINQEPPQESSSKLQVFESGINQETPQESSSIKSLDEPQYLLRPINGVLNYYRRGKKEKRDPTMALQNISLVLNEVSLTISEAQYCDGLKLLEGVSRYRKRIEFSHFRPWVPVLENPRTWWVYACQAGLKQQKKAWSHLSWTRVDHLCSLRRKYVQLYAESLQQKPKTESSEIREIEEEVDTEVLLLWRLLARAKAESLKSKEANAQRDKVKKGGWWGFGWRTAAADNASSTPESSIQKQDRELGDFTKEEWGKINELLNYRPGEDSPLLSSQDAPDSLQMSVDATIKESAVRILDPNKAEILCGNFATLSVGLNLYPKTLECHVKLRSYGLSAPEGSLIKSVTGGDNEQALTACYIQHPLDSLLDWKVSATILPCYVTVWFASFERFMQFLKSSHAVSPDVASKTAAALQNKLEQVRRRAQEQLKLALEEESRFSIHLDLDAPKVRLPADTKLWKGQDTQLLLDLGHFTLHTENEENRKEQGNDGHALRGGLYSQCYVSGSDIAAYLVDGSFDWSEMQHLLSLEADCASMRHEPSTNKDGPILLPVLDRCRMFLLFEKLRIPHPAYPLTHIALQVPHLGLHFSPGRYQRLAQLIATFDNSNGPKDKMELSEKLQIKASWYPSDHEGSVRVLVWKGLGNAVAEWQPCWVVLSGSYLYVLESVNSQTYQRCCSMNERQVLEVPPSNIGGSEFVLAVCNRGMELQKGLESSSTVIMKLADEECKEMWLKILISAVYRASSPVSLSLPEELMDGVEDMDVRPVDFLGQPVLFVTGALHELQLSIYAVTDMDPCGINCESLILSLQAGGGKVNVLQRQYDLTVRMNLYYLKIEDKLQGSAGPSCQYIARSVLNQNTSGPDHELHDTPTKPEIKMKDEEDIYNDALAEFGGSPSISPGSSLNAVHDGLAGRNKKMVSYNEGDFLAWGLDQFKLSPGECLMDKILVETKGELRSFVSMHIITRQFESPDYDGTDVQMSISMATLEFFCNRQTVVALIKFGTEISEIVEQKSEDSDTFKTNAVLLSDMEPSPEGVVVTGLLGQGKSRIVFQLKMNMDSVRIFLNLEDGTQLAMLDQERFQMDLKVFPGSFGISAMLGNLRVCDMTLGSDHQWGWMCDIRDPGCDSLVKLEFQSFNVDEEDYQGYDYSLEGRLSSVRIVFLYRFIQEVTAYFTALSAPHAQRFTRVVDKVGGIERLVPQSAIEGSPALKLNVFLETPIINMPRCSASKEFMQLDLGYLKVSNKFEWHGGLKEDASAIHLDVLSAEISGINLVVGIGGLEGKSMIQEVQGLHVRVCRPLRDLFRRVPEVQVDVEVQTLRGIMSDKEYLVITGCAASNIAEVPHLPPDFRTFVTEQTTLTEGSADKINPEIKRLSSEKSNSSRQGTTTWTTVRVTVEVQNAELELHNGLERESALARVELQGLWLTYRSTSMQEMVVLLTLPRLCVLDLRSGTKPEMRLMLGSMADTEASIVSSRPGCRDDSSTSPQPPMLVMDAKIKPESQAFIIRIQRPRLLVVIDFLLAVGEFFVPALATITGKEESMDVCNDPIIVQEHIRLANTYHKQEAAILTISSSRKLIADYPDVNEFTYDGGGNILCLDVFDNNVSRQAVVEPVIIIGAGKRLLFKNVKIKNGLRLKDCVQLLSHSSYSVSVEDAVVLDGSTTGSNLELQVGALSEQRDTKLITSGSSSTNQTPSDAATNLILDVQAVAPELTFYDSERFSCASLQRRERLLRVKMDLNLMYACKESDVWLRVHVKRLSMDGGSGLTVVEPMVISMEYACVKEKTNLNIFASDVSVQLSFSLMRLLLRLHGDVMSTFQFGGGLVLSRCSHFDRIWVNTEHTSGQKIAIWRPRAPPGYVILSDSVTSGEAPPSQAVMAISNTYHRVRKPSSFDLVWVLQDLSISTFNDSSTTKDFSKGCSIWRPVAPPGYVAVGCVAKIGSTPPALSSVYCVRSDLVTSASINDCVLYVPSHPGTEKGFSLWRIENAAGSFFAHQSTEPPASSSIYELRGITFEGRSPGGSGLDLLDSRNKLKSGRPNKLERKQSMSGLENFGITAKADRLIATTAQFERMWWDKGSDNRRIISIWRPIPPPGYAIVGDHITEGLEPPSVGIVLQDDNSGRLADPIRFVQCMHSPGKGLEEVYIWYPVAPAGYVTLGCVVSKDEDKISLSTVRCVRADLVSEANISEKPIWNVSGAKSGYNCSLWKLQNQANTFLARPDLKKPPARLAYGLVEAVQSRLEDNLSADINIAKISITLLDDLRGVITPLADVTVTSINLAANGRAEALTGVCVASMAASTFNAQLEAWEPFIEPFEGIFKCESHDSQSGSTFKVGKRIRITTANIVNVNVTSANVVALVDSISSWRRQSELEQIAFNKMELESDGIIEPSMARISSALEEDDSEKLVIKNKLGCGVFLRTFEHEFRDCKVLEAGNSVQVCVPPPNFRDKFTSGGLKIPQQHVAIHISEARDLPLNNDGNGQEYFYSLRVASVKQVAQGQKNSGQSARSRCVRPSALMQSGNTMVATAAWNEVFIFDLPHQGFANMDIRVSNQAANAGRGELIGMLSLPLRAESDQETSHWKLVQQQFLSQTYQSSWPSVQEKTYSLEFPKKQVHSNMDEARSTDHGSLVVKIYFFTEKANRPAEEDIDRNEHCLKDTGLLMGLSSGGPWTSIRSVLALGTVPVQITNGHLALEVAMNEGQKLATLRNLVMLSNDTDNVLDVCVCPMSLLTSPDEVPLPVNTEPVDEVLEIFENQRYQLLAGWGSKWPGHFLPTDPGRWSTRDYQKSSQSREDLEPYLPRGWIWTTDWIIDKAGYVDDEGWAYGADFQSLRWPPNSIKSCKKSPFDFIRRRRWTRTRQRVPDSDQVHSRQVISEVQPGESIPIPLGYTLSQTDYCLQVRPQLESTITRYLWGRSVSAANQSTREYAKSDGQSSGRRLSRIHKSGIPVSSFMLNHLEKTEELLMCPPANPSASRAAWWLSMESDANILYNEVNSPVCDWKLSVSAPLKLENLLPCSAEYTIWEKHKEGSPVQRDRGVVPAGGTIHIFSVDIRRQVYLTWLVQGGWKLEKEIVLISDPMTEELPSAFSLINQQSHRRLQLSLERDFGSTNAAPRTVRIFVPYWLCNKAALPLSYCLVEVEPVKGSDGDTPWLMRAVKAAKHAASRPSHSQQSKSSRLQRVIQCLEFLENTGGTPTMLSPQAQLNRTGFMPFSTRAADDGLLSSRLGISVCALRSNDFNYGISFKDLEDNERVIVKAMDENGSYYKLSVFLIMSSERTKVVNFQPHTLFVNRLGQQLYLRQCDLDCAELLYPNDPPKVVLWQSAKERELMKVCVDGYKWSTPFSVDIEGTSHIILRSESSSNIMLIRAEIRNGTTESRYLVIFRHVSFTSPYRIENQSIVFPICFRQAGGCNDSWQLLPPGCAVPFAWEDLQRERKLEIIVDGADPLKSRTYAIDESVEFQPIVAEGAAVAAFHVKTVREGSTQVVKIGDWMPSNTELSIVPVGNPIKMATQEQAQLHNTKQSFQHHEIEDQVHVLLELAELGLSLVDHSPEEILYLSIQNFTLAYATGLGSGISRLKVRVAGLQVDNQLPLTPMPVLFRTQVPANSLDFVFKCTITLQDDGSSNRYLYPYIGVQGSSTANAAFFINIHEPIIWRLHQMFQHLNLNRLTASQTTDVSVDPIVYIGLLYTSEIRFKVSLVMSPTQRPRGALGFWASLMTALGNTDDLEVRIAPRVREDVCMRQSSLLAACMESVRKDLLSHPLLLLSGVDILGNASSALGHMSKGVAALSMDKKFIRSRQRQDTKASVEGFGDGFREGAEAFGKGLFRGVTGIVTKPFEGARSSGMEGFVQGVGKGIIGVAAQPVSGVLDLLSKTTEGANAMKTKIAAVITSEGVLLRRRLPRVIGADNILRPYDEYKAQGQILLQLAEGGSIFGPMDIFKIRGKFAMSDAYEDHYNLPKGRTLIITHRRVILLQHPTSIIVQKKLDLMKDPCSVLWDVMWNDLRSMELIPGKRDPRNERPSRLVLHLQGGPVDAHRIDSKDLVRIVKCNPDTDQAAQICAAIQQAISTYGPDQSLSGIRRAQQKNVKRPYSGIVQDPTSMSLFEGAGTAVNLPPMATFSALMENTS